MIPSGGANILLNTSMKVYEILTDAHLQEVDFKKIGKAAATGAAAGLVGASLMGQPKDMPAPVTQQPAPIEQPIEQPADTATKFPTDLKDLSVAEKKQKFFDVMIPVIEKANKEILADREKFLDIVKKETRTDEDRKWVHSLMKKYRTTEVKDLLYRVDIVPVSLAVAQGAIESGWGTSRFAQQGNAVFGQRDYSGGGMKPKGASGFTVAQFGSIADSVKSYIKNLNTHDAYADFRSVRKQMRDKEASIDSLSLVKTLSKYSELGPKYTRDVSSIIRSNKLQQYDNI